MLIYKDKAKSIAQQTLHCASTRLLGSWNQTWIVLTHNIAGYPIQSIHKIILGLAPIDAFDSFAKWNIFTMQLGTQPFSNQYSLCLNMAFHLFLGWWEFSRGIETFCVLVRCHAYHLGSVESQSTPIENGTLLRPGTRLLTTQVMPLLTHAETLSIWTIKPLIFHPCNGQLLCFQ